ncbi:MAG TPA: DmsC/YnfH family molybdoenzyme membrane anchor subunit, partial [Nitrospiria bacterium]|nr:DmsC/YnfH family molybdoenzyme membrane anchor subunit [Nitrospiria bacterium]
MAYLADVTSLVLIQIAIGGTILLPILPESVIGLGFFRFNSLLFLALFCAGLALMPDVPFREVGPSILFALSLLIYHLLSWTKAAFARRILLLVTALTGVVVLLMTPLALQAHLAIRWKEILMPLSFLISSLLLGSVVDGMILGHSYLNIPALPTKLLMRFSILFLVGLVFQGGFTLFSILSGMKTDLVRSALFLQSFEGLFLWMRVAIGIIGPLILAVMILETVRIRSTQSATGLLYIAM